MIIWTWNIRGINDPNKIRVVIELVSKYKVNVIGILGTTIRPNISKVIRKLGKKWTWSHNYSYSHKGHIWVGWDEQWVSVTVLTSSKQCITIKVQGKGGQTSINVTIVYGLHTIMHRRALWDELRSVNVLQSPWIIMGD